jgi:N-acetylneuraminic acid mutarotase
MKSVFLLIFQLVFTCLNSFIQGQTTIVSDNVSPVYFCSGSNVTVTFTAAGVFNPGNTFTAQLSDENGSFTSPDSIGSVLDTTGGTIFCIIPEGVLSGTSYRIRIVSSNPFLISNNNSVDLSVFSPEIVASGSTTFCTGDSIILFANSGNIFFWNTGDTSTTINVKSSGNYSVEINGCQSDSVLIAVNPLPIISITQTFPFSICEDTVILTASDASSYLWNTGAVTQSISIGNPGDYFVNCYDTNGCSSTSGLTVTMNPILSASSSSNSPVCTGDSIFLSASGGISYYWSGPNNFTSMQQNPVIPNPNSINNGSYKVTVSDNNRWIQKSSMGSFYDRSGCVTFSIKNKGYAGMGESGNSPLGDFHEYDPTSNTWTYKGIFTGPHRYGAVSFCIGNKGYLGTGLAPGLKKDFWEYDPILNSWTQKADFGGVARYYAVGFSIGDKGYIGTGHDGTGYKQDIWEYNQLLNVWVQKTNFPGAGRFQAVGFSISNKGYIGTGQTNGSNGTYFVKDFWEFDPNTNLWIQLTDFGGVGRYGASGFSIDNKGYIGLGWGGISNFQNDFWEYNPINNQWIQKANFPGMARTGGSSFTINNRGYIVAGRKKDIYTQDLWEYIPDSGCIPYAITNVEVFPLPEVFASSNSPVCTEDSIQFFSAGGENYSWNGPLLFSSSQQYPVLTNISSDNSGYYFVQVTDSNNCKDTSGIYVIVHPVPISTATSNGPVCIGDTINLFANKSGGTATYSWTGPNGFSSTDPNPVVPNPDSTFFGNYILTGVDSNNCLDVDTVAVVNCFLSLNMKMFLEGYYTGGSMMDNYGGGGCLYINGLSPDASAADTVIVSAMDPITYALVDSKKSIMNIDGTVNVTFEPTVVAGNSYYIKVNHRNAIETWSAAPVLFSALTSYDFTTTQSQAYGNNMSNVGPLFSEPPVWAFYSGDISDPSFGVGYQDGIIESQDYADMENAVYNILSGYVFEDLTGDGIVESSDYSLMENNVYSIISAIRP